MRIPHDALVVVADGRKLLMFRNEGDGLHVNLQVERKEIHENPKDGDQKTDLAGRASSTLSGSMEETDYHQLEEDRFAAEVADILKKGALANDYDKLVIAAPPRTLGELRKNYHKEVSARLLGEIDKDLTGHPVPEIEKLLQNA